MMWFWDAVVFRSRGSGYVLVLFCLVLQAAGVRGAVVAHQRQRRQQTVEEEVLAEQQYPPLPKTVADVFGALEDSESPLLGFFSGRTDKSVRPKYQYPSEAAHRQAEDIRGLSSFRTFGEWRTEPQATKPLAKKDIWGRSPGDEEDWRLAPFEVPGVVFSLIVGLIAGSIMVPMSFADLHGNGSVAFLPSMAFGMFVASTLAVLYAVSFCKIHFSPDLQLKTAFIPGLGSGCLWTVAAFCVIYSIDYMSYTVNFIVLASSLFINGFCGIVWHQELNGKALQYYMAAAGILFMTALFLFCEESGLVPFAKAGPPKGPTRMPPPDSFSYSYLDIPMEDSRSTNYSLLFEEGS